MLIFGILILFGVSAVAQENLVARYTFEGDFTDASANGLDATANGDAALVYDADLGSNVVTLDGDGDYLDFGGDALFNWQGGWTAAFWVKLRNWDEGWDTFLKKGDSYSFERSIDQESLAFYHWPNWTGTTVDFTADGQWHHIAATLDGAEQRLYLDGDLIATVPNAGAFAANANPVILGSDGGGGRYIDASFDDVRFYRSALSEKEIEDLATIDPSNFLVAHYMFDGDFTDATANSLDGTANGDAAVVYDARLGSNVVTLDGDGDYVDFGGDALFNWQGGWTAAFWVKLRNWDEGWDTFLKKSNSYSFERNLDQESLAFYHWPNWTGTTVDFTADGQWHHIAATLNGAEQRLYLDGELIARVPNAGAFAENANSVILGSDGGEGRFIDASFDDVRFYRTALPEGEIVELARIDPADLLVAHYMFEGDFTDASGNGLNAMAYGDAAVVFDAGLGSSVVTLDGDGDYVDLGGDSLFNWQGAWTAAFWVKLRNWDEGWDTFLKKGDSFSFERSIDQESLAFYHWPNLTGTTVDFTADGQWHHIAATLDGAEQRMYLDGELIAAVANAGAFAENVNAVILGSAGGEGRFIDACFDEVRIYAGALTEQEVAELADMEAANFLVANYTFTGDFTDASRNNLDGTAFGDAAIVYDAARESNVVTLDGDGDYVSFGGDPLFNWQGAWTAAFWVRLRDWDEGWDTFLKKNDSFSFERNIDGEQLAFYHWPNWSASTVPLTADDQWHHIAATLDGTNQSVYLDGELIGSIANAGAFVDNANSVILGSAGGDGRFLDASFDNVQIFSVALDGNQIKELAGVVTVEESKLAAHYPFEGNFNDASDNFLHGTPNGDAAIVYDPDRESNVVALDGDGDYVDFGDDDLFDWNGAWTAAFWVKLVEWDEGWDTFLKKDNAYSFERNIDQESLAFYHWPNWAGTTGPLTADGTWHHVAATLDGTTQSLYIDGYLASSVANAGAFADTDAPVILGSDGGTSRFINGFFDDLMIYNEALSSEAIRTMAGAPPFQGTIVQFDFEDDLVNSAALGGTAMAHGNVSFVDGMPGMGKAVYLDNDAETDTSWIEFPDIPELDITGNMTIQGWFKYADTTPSDWNNPSYLVSKVHKYGDYNYRVWNELNPTVSGGYDAAENAGFVDSPVASVSLDSAVHFADQWYQFTFQRDSALRVVTTAVHDENGDLIDFNFRQSHPALDLPATSDLPLLLGRSRPVTDDYFNGYLDEVKISNVLEAFDLPPVILYPHYLTNPVYSQKIGNQDENLTQYEVSASIAVVGAANGIASAKVMYHTVADPYEKVAMDDPRWLEADMTEGVDNLYTGYIPQQPFGTVIDYYITATSATGKMSTFGANPDSTYDRIGVWRENDMVLKLSFEEDDLNFIDSTDYNHDLVTLGDWVIWDDPDDQVEGNFCAYLPEGSDALGEIISPFLSTEAYTITAWVRPEPDLMEHNTYIISNTPHSYNDNYTPMGPWWNINYSFLHRYQHIKNDVYHENRWPGEFPWHGDRSFVPADTLGNWAHYLVNCGPESLVVQINDENDLPVERSVYRGPLGTGWEHDFIPIAPSLSKFRIGPPGPTDATPQYSGYLDEIVVYNYQTMPGNFALLPTNVKYETIIPKQYALFHNYPNPFNPTTHIRFNLPKTEQVTIKIYDVIGRLTKTLVDQKMRVGQHTITWDGTDERGIRVTSGVYFYRLETEGYSKTRKMLLLK